MVEFAFVPAPVPLEATCWVLPRSNALRGELLELLAVVPVVPVNPAVIRTGWPGLGVTPMGVSIGAEAGVWTNGNGMTPVTEITSLSAAGSDIRRCNR